MSQLYEFTDHNTVRVKCDGAVIEIPLPGGSASGPLNPADGAADPVLSGYRPDVADPPSTPVTPVTPIGANSKPPIGPYVMGIVSSTDKELKASDFILYEEEVSLQITPFLAQWQLEQQVRDIVAGLDSNGTVVSGKLLNIGVTGAVGATYKLPDLRQFIGGDSGVKGIRFIQLPFED